MNPLEISMEVTFFIALILPLLFWGWRIKAQLDSVQKTGDDLMKLHLDKHSLFSNVRTNELLEKQGRETVQLMKDLIHYTIAGFEAETGKKLKPPKPHI